MTDRELMQMALDALEEAKENVMDWGAYASEYFKTKHGLAQDILAIENISEALRARLAQPEPEPVAWADKYDLDREGHDFWVSRQANVRTGVPLYTAPKAIEAKLKEKNS